MKFDLKNYYFNNSSFLETLTAKTRTSLSQATSEKKFKAGKVIYREGKTPRGVYFIKKGKVKIFQSNQDGRKQIMYIYTPGDIFGYRPIISESVHPVTAATLEDCIFGFISAQNFKKIMSSNPELTKALLVSLSHEFTVWVNNVSVFARYPVKSRVALALLILREKYREKGRYVDINLSRTDLASYVGSVKETVVRTLQDFRNANLILTTGRKIKILKPDVLTGIANFY
ncbi:MAG: Crp/Fnr family transcriptional regulator [Bacteroidia bacterium]|nr:Crp/Fnr family transcriptional regulator [Bacteroidia bacterium]